MAHAATTLPKPARTEGRDDSFSDRLRKARRDAGVTMAQMGIALGVSPQQVLKYERGQNRLCADRLPIWAATCGVTVDDLLGQTGRDTISLFGAEGVMSLVQAFTAITDASVRQTLIEMARALAIVDRQRRERPAG